MSGWLTYNRFGMLRGDALPGLWLGIWGPALVLAAFIVSVAATAQVRFASKEGAFTQGYSAYKSGQYEIAVPALQFAAERGVMRAKFYLAKIYSDNSGGRTDHGMAYRLLTEIVDDHAGVDPKDYRVAPYVAQALTSIARYERQGIKSLKLPPSTKRALVFFDHAATYFSDADAQFELAKHYLAGDGVEARVAYALNWLAGLSKRGHAGAQAFLANLYWDGRYTERDPVRALALITVAVENARQEDRFWIEDVHQNIFCEADTKTRRKVHNVVDGWRQRFGRARTLNVDDKSAIELGDLPGNTARVCANGDIVGELIPKPAATGTINAAVAPNSPAAQTGRSNTAPPGAVLGLKPAGSDDDAEQNSSDIVASHSKPDERTDRSSLNGFGVKEASSLERLPPDRPKSTLNGFILRGQSGGFGFSFDGGGERR